MNKLKIISAISLGTILIATSAYAKTGKVNIEELIVRGGPSTSTENLGGLKENTEVEILDEENGFYKIKYNDITGYVRGDLLDVDEETIENDINIQVENSENISEVDNTQEIVEDSKDISTETEMKDEYPKNVELSNEVNLYMFPLIGEEITTKIEAGKQIIIQKEIGNWAYISFENSYGWVRKYNLINTINIMESTEIIDEQKTENSETERNVTNEQEPEVQTSEITKGFINVGSVNVRESATTDSAIVTVLTRNTGVKILSVEGEWSKVQYGDFNGYIKSEFISDEMVEVTNRSDDDREATPVETTKGYISVQLANVREKASSSSKVLTTLKQKAEVQVMGTEGEFSKVILSDGTTAYVATRLIVNSLDDIDEIPQNTSNNSKPVYNSTGTVSGQGIVDFAKQFFGYKYVYGGTTPEGGFDCSGFVYYVFNSCGVKISRSCSVQASSGKAVKKENLQLGDIIFFNNTSNGSIGHVGIYIGNGEFIHASNPTRGVVKDTINSGYYCTYYYSARRVL